MFIMNHKSTLRGDDRDVVSFLMSVCINQLRTDMTEQP